MRAASILLLTCLLAAANATSHAAASASRIDYNRDIRPILSDHCYACHGPDQDKRKAGLRLDRREEALSALKSGSFAIVPGSLEKSELVHRITATDGDDRMPPAQLGKPLSERQIEALRQWVAQGAEWTGHWAYQSPERPALPKVKNPLWARNEIDHFVLDRLDREGMPPSAEADRTTLARRLSLDLTGLPPTVSEVESFLYDNRPDAYEKLVDRLLESPQYGERMAQYWLDLARYADSQGYHHDSHRDLWHWRDWVINAFNRNQPFDQFTTEQIAGDLLPNPTREQIIATGFNRNEMTTSEGGADPNEYAVKYVVGRVDTTSRLWLGSSMACAECHDHKYDPITQKEYYQFFAFFNTVAEHGMDQQENPVPQLRLDTPEQKAKLEQMSREITALEAAHASLIDSPHPQRDALQAEWAGRLRTNAVNRWTAPIPQSVTAQDGATPRTVEDGSVIVEGANPAKQVYEVALRSDLTNLTGLRIEAIPDATLPETRAGRSEKGDFLLTRLTVEVRSARPETVHSPVEYLRSGNWHQLGPFGADSAAQAFSKTFGPENGVDLKQVFNNGDLKWSEAAQWTDGNVFSLGDTANSATYLYRTFESGEAGRAWLSLGSDDGIQVWWNGRKLLSREVARSAAPDQDKVAVAIRKGENKLLIKISNGGGGSSVYFKVLPDPVVAYEVEFAAAVADQSARDFGPGGALDGDPATGWSVDFPEKTEPAVRRVFFRAHDLFGFAEGGELRVRMHFESERPRYSLGRFRVAVTDSDVLPEFFGLPDAVRLALHADSETITESQKRELRRYHRQTFVTEVQELAKLLDGQRKAKDAFFRSIPVTMVMQEMEKPRETFLLVRGNFQNRGEKVAPGVPEKLFPMPEGLPLNRLGLAKWLTDPKHPLVSRVTVNRFWQRYFGTGLVKTAEDFGSQGEWPSHPELLDWLATEFIRLKWDVKAMQRLIVTSATYRQAARVTREHLDRDPENRWLARFPRLRLEAEQIRDSALAISGLLQTKVGGPSVYPYQPPGLWEAVAFEGSRKYIQSSGPENYRRGLYTYWRRSMPYPSLIAFDAPTRETCTIRRPRTNTPLQALVLMNDPVYVETARAFAERILRDGGPSVETRLVFAVRTCLGRTPSKQEVLTLEQAYARHLATFEANRVAASKLIHVGVSAPPVDADLCELAAWTVIGNTLLNLDETVTRN